MSQLFGIGRPPLVSTDRALGDLTSDQLIERRSGLADFISGQESLGRRGLRGSLLARASEGLARLDRFAPRLVPEGGGKQGPGIADQQAALGASGSLGRRVTRLGGTPARGNRLGGSKGNIFKQRLGR